MPDSHLEDVAPAPRSNARETFAAFVDQATADPAVVGLVLKGSQSHANVPTRHSDYDLYVVIADDGDTALSRLAGFRSAHLDLVVLSLSEFRTVGLPASSESWERYAFVHAEVLLDRRDGLIAELVERKAKLTADEARRIAGDYLDAYINSLYRSLKNHRDGFADAAHLDATESIPFLLTTVFALDRRVRPYNKYLRWELERQPLSSPLWAADRLLPRLRELIAAGDPDLQRELFAEVEAVARAQGHGAVIDAWGADLLLLRGPAGGDLQ
ncbi:MAG: hypothetical protein HOW97_22965 [Catenulispora sp.]|nr:hypothetical protein [Catenulispora sp.]